jgi:hypothetical protein
LPKMNFENANWPCDWEEKLIDINGLYGRSKGHSFVWFLH